ncbi:adenylate/guanylate cyclase domain-containing protein [Nocardioides sp. URHA0032]|uniref:adenylate/guanylate cyclase domain-containing protein n=1 Tax=Nocardioides sp. URHA0032 TaxID=1380388 RepID=UPI00048E4B45|nr:adenylate/guanylate cyclase domain-containing protein [Nocardioides sp. URHA0032]
MDLEPLLLGGPPTLNRVEVAARAGVPLDLAQELWRLLGFPRTGDEDVAFTEADVDALRQARELMELGVIGPDSQSALVRTWGRSYARLAEWQASLLAAIDPSDELAREALPRVEALQSYTWRRHLASASARVAAAGEGGTTSALAVGFVDIVGYTSRSKHLEERELVEWLEHFEAATTGLVVDHGGRIIKTIGDEVLFVVDGAAPAAEVALLLTEREEPFPSVRVGLAYGDVVSRLGDVFGPTVNIASRLTGVARPGSVLVDRGCRDELAAEPAYTLREMRRTPVKGYARLHPFVLRRAPADGPGK